MKIVSENLFSGKTYLYTFRPLSVASRIPWTMTSVVPISFSPHSFTPFFVLRRVARLCLSGRLGGFRRTECASFESLLRCCRISRTGSSPCMTSTYFWDILTPSPFLSAKSILIVSKFGAFLDPLFPLLCGLHIWKPLKESNAFDFICCAAATAAAAAAAAAAAR